MAGWFTNAGITETQFLHQHWRKQATRLGQLAPLTALADALDQETLLQLCESDLVESRLVGCDQNGRFSLSTGPFELDAVPTGTMLMIQGLESIVDEVSSLVSEQFSFLPRWRIEDVMATLANQGASCGAHFDYYDVFLLQVRGSKQWQLDEGGHRFGDLRTDTDIRLLAEFCPTSEFEQGPGSLLYIPPGVGHLGLASDDSLTLSVGIRNPTHAEMLSHLADLLLDGEPTGETLDDEFAGNVLDSKHIMALQAGVLDQLKSHAVTRSWFGTYMTQLKEPDLISWPDSDLTVAAMSAWLARQKMLRLQLPARIAFMPEPSGLQVYANGEMVRFNFSAESTEDAQMAWLATLQQARQVPTADLPENRLVLDILVFLYNEGALVHWDTSE